MISAADWLSRRLWFAMLWFMRRPFMRRLQRASLTLFPQRYRPRAEENFKRQERLARRYGLHLLRWTILLFFLSVALTVTYLVALNLLIRLEHSSPMRP